MANQEHLELLTQGVEVWNQWREAHRDIQPDLSSANLSGADLSSANLSFAGLSNADFLAANLSNVNLSATILNRTVFYASNLSNVDLSGANLSNVVFGYVDLSTAKGLETVSHLAPSTIGIDTIYRSQGTIPEAFLKGAGVDDIFITYIRSLAGKPIEYYSCFISYSSKDDAFARRLHADLQSHNVRCWFAPEDLKWGERIRTGIDEAIRLHDKLLLVLSKSSVASGWVEREVKTALAKERKENRTVLFPVRVDRAVFESPFDWATEIRHERNIGDFTRWKDHDNYQKAFTRLLRDLKAEAQKMGSQDATTNGG
jgi:TIR domain/Pentapeptide repeats (8 copies)